MAISQLRQTVTTGKVTGLLLLGAAVVAWGHCGGWSADCCWQALAALAGIGGLLQWTDYGLALIRERSWLIGSLYVALGSLLTFMHGLDWSFAVVGIYILTLVTLCGALDSGRPQVWVFQSVMLWALGLALEPRMAWLLPVLMVNLVIQFRCLSLRTISAALFGIVVAAELLAATFFAFGWPDGFEGMWQSVVPDLMFDYSEWSAAQCTSLAFAAFWLAVGALHYKANHLDDDVSTRMFIYTILMHGAVFLLLAMLFPSAYVVFMRLALVSVAVIMAHLMVLAEGRWADVAMWLFAVSCILLFIYNLCNPSLTFSWVTVILEPL